MHIAQNFWPVDFIKKELPLFLNAYAQRPLEKNDGGMKLPHMFASWCMIKSIQPRVIIESGVWYGQGTWLLEQAAPEAQLLCIEPVQERIVYRSKRAIYQTKDFRYLDCSAFPKEDTVVFFDDHQNAFHRLAHAKHHGLKHLIFEDNYPAGRGDCYSIKKILMKDGSCRTYTVGEKFFAFVKGHSVLLQRDRNYAEKQIAVYAEFPPLYIPSQTRWGDEWENMKYPTPVPIFSSVQTIPDDHIVQEASAYTWICYVRLV